MKHPLEWAATHLNKPGYFCAFQIVAGLIGANAAGVLLSHFQALGHIPADSIGHRSGGEVLHSIAVLARLSGDVEVISLIAPLAGAVIGTLLTCSPSLGILQRVDARARRALPPDPD